MSNLRRGTRVSCEIEVILKRLDPGHEFSEPCKTMLVNPQGCAAKFGRPLPVGAVVELEGLPGNQKVTARVVNCISLGEHEKFWILGLALDEPGNVWGVHPEPEDWFQTVKRSQREQAVTGPSRFFNFLRRAVSR